MPSKTESIKILVKMHNPFNSLANGPLSCPEKKKERYTIFECHIFWCNSNVAIRGADIIVMLCEFNIFKFSGLLALAFALSLANNILI